MVQNNIFKNIIDDLDAGYWELNDDSSNWSSAFINNLGYTPEDVTIKLDYFLDHLIHEKDRSSFKDNFNSFVKHDLHFKQGISVLAKNGTYQEYVCKTNQKLPVNIKADSKVIFFFKIKLRTNEKVKPNNFYYQETATMTETGSWYVDLVEQKSYWDFQTRQILEYPEDYIPSIKDSFHYYPEEHRGLAAEAFMKCAMTGKPVNTEIKMLTKTGRKFWVKAIGKAVYNDKNDIIGVRGVFQDIDDQKQRELTLEKTSEVIASQNSRLFNFAHIVSHNLRSHSSNLALIVQLIEEIESTQEKLELLGNVKDISESLNTTIEHLNEVVTIQTNINQNKEQVNINDTLKQVERSIGNIIKVNNASITSNFSAVESIDYIPAYLESILLNLTTNAIKYKHADRDPEIYVSTYKDPKDNDRVILEIKDNGRGIDLDKFGEKLFGMYKTFHYNKDAVGIGLFITKNQVESLNGEIEVQSKVGEGTTFTIKF